MTQIAATDSALVDLLEGCDLPGVTIMSAPHEWDAGFIQRLLTVTPAVLVAFLGAEPFPDTATSTALALVGKWGVYVCTGWNGKDQAARRLGAGAGFDLMHRAAAAIHTARSSRTPNGDRLATNDKSKGLQRAETDSVGIDIANLWIGSDCRFASSCPLSCYLERVTPAMGRSTIYLKTRARRPTFRACHEFDPDAGDDIGDDGDVDAEIDMPQSCIDDGASMAAVQFGHAVRQARGRGAPDRPRRHISPTPERSRAS